MAYTRSVCFHHSVTEVIAADSEDQQHYRSKESLLMFLERQVSNNPVSVSLDPCIIDVCVDNELIVLL